MPPEVCAARIEGRRPASDGADVAQTPEAAFRVDDLLEMEVRMEQLSLMFVKFDAFTSLQPKEAAALLRSTPQYSLDAAWHENRTSALRSPARAM